MDTTEHHMLDAAQAYIARGFRIIPLHTSKGGCCSCHLGFKCPPKSQGKHPINSKWQTAEILSDADVYAYWGEDKPRNIGIVTGPESGILVLDVDGEDGQASLAELVKANGALPRTLTQKTGSGGWHFVFPYPDFEVGNSAGKLGKGLDTRGKGGFIVAAPSVSGRGPYSWVEARGGDIAPAPDWLLDLLRPKVRAVTEPVHSQKSEYSNLDPAERRRLDAYTEGAVINEIGRLRALHPEVWNGQPWNNTVFEVSANLIQLALADWNGYAMANAYEDLTGNAPRDPGFGQDIIDRTFASAERKVEGQPAAYPPKPPDLLQFFHGSDLKAEPVIEQIASGSGTYPSTEGKPLAVDAESEDDVFRSNTTPAAEAVPEVVVVDLDYVVKDIPVEPETMTLDLHLVQRRLAEVLGIAYSSVAAHEINDDASFEPPLDALVPRPDTFEDDDELEHDLNAWLETNLLSGSPALFWSCLRTILDGIETEGPVIVFKGGHQILAALAATLHPPVGDTPEMLLFGPRVSTREVSEPMIVLAFDDEDCPPVAGRGLALLSLAAQSAPAPLEPPPPPEEGNVHLPDYRAAQLERTRLGMARIRREGDTHATQDAS